jgi:HEAT repeat protein
LAAEPSIPILSKLLLESPINKAVIAEAMINMGNLGEEKLLEIIDKNKQYNNNQNDKLISSIAKSFAFVNLNSTNLDKVIQFLCHQLNKSLSPSIRKNCLFSLRKLSNRLTKNNPNINFNESIENNNYIYLTEKNIIPIFYEKLKDKDFEIQKYAIDCILEFGAKGELVFIEGLLKDKSPMVRCNCAVGLCLFGVHTLRTLINKGLFDTNKSVRINIQGAIIHFFKIDDIINYYQEKGQLLSLKILLDEYLTKGEDITLDFFKFTKNLLDKIMNVVNQ